jgi:hypothetical protein
MAKKPPKPKDAKEARFRKRNREEDRETYEYLDKQSRRNGPVKKDPPPKPKKKPIKKREGGEVKYPKKMNRGGKVSMPKKMKRGGKVSMMKMRNGGKVSMPKKMSRGGRVKKMAKGGVVKGPYS